MLAPRPAFCRPQAYAEFARWAPQADTPQGLVRAGCAIAMHADETADGAPCWAALERIASTVASRCVSGHIEALVAHLHDVLFDVIGFRGVEGEDYYNPRNSYLPWVMQSHRGIPITLCLVYRATACLVGLNAVGVNAPGHFLAAIDQPGKERMYVDPFFGGRLLEAAEVYDRIAELSGRPIPPSPELLQTASSTQWLARMLMNLQANFARSGEDRHMYAMQELQSLLSATDAAG